MTDILKTTALLLLAIAIPFLSWGATVEMIAPDTMMVDLDEFEVVGVQRPYAEVIPSQRLSGDQLESLNSHSVADAVRYFSGVQIKDYGGVGGVKTVDIRSMGTNPEVAFDAVWRGRTQETQMDFAEAAVLTGLGEIGLHGAILTDEFGPFVRVCFVLTDAEIEATPVKEPHLCDGCGECVRGCPGHAISEDGTVDPWQCAVYYNGANGTKNPFMPPDAFANFEDRLDIIAGEAKVTPEKAREILRNIYFYPPAQHAYQCSICGRACDMNCYVHLEEKGLLSKNFNTPFRKREEWKFDIQDFKKKGE